LKTDNSLKTVCLYLPSHVTENSAKKRSSYFVRKEAVRDGVPTVVRFADGRLAFRKSKGNGFQSSTGLRSCMYPEIKTDARNSTDDAERLPLDLLTQVTWRILVLPSLVTNESVAALTCCDTLEAVSLQRWFPYITMREGAAIKCPPLRIVSLSPRSCFSCHGAATAFPSKIPCWFRLGTVELQEGRSRPHVRRGGCIL
jgi:hypothetical protein